MVGLYISMALSLVLHLLLIFAEAPKWDILPAKENELPLQKYVKHQLPAQRPLARRIFPAPVQRPMARKPAARSTPRAALRPAPLTTTRQLSQGLPIPLVATLPPVTLPPTPLAMLLPSHIGPAFQSGAVQGARAGAEEIDLGLELLGVEALNTGQHRAVVVVDPKDRQEIKGFLYLSGVCSPSLERAERDSPIPRRISNLRPKGLGERQMAERETLQGLADRMSAHTQVHVQVRDQLSLDDPQLMEVPFLLLTVNNTFSFTEAEAANLGRYLVSGGFLYAEVASRPRRLGNDHTVDWPALRQLIRSGLALAGYREGKDWQFVRLEPEHSLFHCFYDIDSLPRGFWDWPYVGYNPQYLSPEHIEGILVGEQLVGLYSLKDYADFRGGEAERIRAGDRAANLANGRFSIGGEELRPYDLGINVLVYALTREGSLAQRLVAVE